MSTEKRKPTWTVCVNENQNAPAGSKPKWRSIGAAWETSGGNLWLRLDEGERLSGVAMLFPYREKNERSRGLPRHSPAMHAPAQPSEPDYMERQRQARAARPSVSAPPKPYVPPSNADEPCPDPEPPDWL